MEIMERLYAIIHEWEESEEYTRQAIFTEVPELYFERDIQDEYNILSYHKEYHYLEYDEVEGLDAFTVTLSFFRKDNPLREVLDNDGYRLLVVSGGEKPDSVYIRDNEDFDYKYADMSNYVLHFDTELDGVNVYTVSTTWDAKMNKKSLEHIDVLSLCKNNKFITIDNVYTSDTDKSLVNIISAMHVCDNLKINNLYCELINKFFVEDKEYDSENYLFTHYVDIFSNLDPLVDKCNLFVYTTVKPDKPLSEDSNVYRFTKDSMEEEGMDSLHFKIYAFVESDKKYADEEDEEDFGYLGVNTYEDDESDFENYGGLFDFEKVIVFDLSGKEGIQEYVSEPDKFLPYIDEYISCYSANNK
jgi:hypothetical protein